MIRKILILILICSSFVVSQVMPDTYKLGEKSLQKTNDNSPIGNSIGDIAVVDGRFWAATGQGLAMTEDNGASWKNFPLSNFNGNKIYSMGYHEDIIWVAVGKKNSDDVDVGGGIWFSQDLGENWSHIPQPVDDPGDSSIVYGINTMRILPVVVPEQNVIWDMAFTSNTVWIASWAGGIRKCKISDLLSDVNTTWDRIVLPADFLDSITPSDTLNYSIQVSKGKFGDEAYLNHLGFSVAPVSDDEIYVGTVGGVNKSTDGGVSWVKYNNIKNGLAGDWIVGLDINPYNGEIWAASWKGEGSKEFFGVSFSSDGGENWNTSLNGVKANNFGFKFNEVIAATNRGLYRTNDQGVNWIAATSLTDIRSGAQIQSSFFISVDTEYLSDDKVNLWIGSSGGLSMITEDNDSEVWEGEWNVFKVSEALSSSDKTYCAPNPYYPSSNRPMKIVYSTKNKPASVTIRVFDFDMNLVKTIIQNATREGQEVEDYWDGRDEAGKVVPNGVYFYTVVRDDADPIYNKIMILR